VGGAAGLVWLRSKAEYHLVGYRSQSLTYEQLERSLTLYWRDLTWRDLPSVMAAGLGLTVCIFLKETDQVLVQSEKLSSSLNRRKVIAFSGRRASTGLRYLAGTFLKAGSTYYLKLSQQTS